MVIVAIHATVSSAMVLVVAVTRKLAGGALVELEVAGAKFARTTARSV